MHTHTLTYLKFLNICLPSLSPSLPSYPPPAIPLRFLSHLFLYTPAACIALSAKLSTYCPQNIFLSFFRILLKMSLSHWVFAVNSVSVLALFCVAYEFYVWCRFYFDSFLHLHEYIYVYYFSDKKSLLHVFSDQIVWDLFHAKLLLYNNYWKTVNTEFKLWAYALLPYIFKCYSP